MKQYKLTRREVLGGTALSGTAMLAGCFGGNGNGNGESFRPKDAESFPVNNLEETLNLWTWYNGVAEYAQNAYPEEFDAVNTVNWQGYSNPSDWYSPVEAGTHDVDSASGNAEFVVRAIENDLLEPLPIDQMEAWENRTQQAKDIAQEYYSKDGEVYALPEDFSLNPTLTYNTEVFDEPPDSYGVLWDEEFAGQIAYPDQPMWACQVAAAYTGQSHLEPEDYDEIEEVLIQQKELIDSYWPDQSVGMQMMADEEAVVGVMPLGRVYEARFDQGAPVDHTSPKEGAFAYTNGLVIPKGAPHPRSAVNYTNWIGLPENAVQYFLTMGYVQPIQNAKELLMDNDVPEEEADFVSIPEDWDINFRAPVDEEVVERFDEIWTNVQAA